MLRFLDRARRNWEIIVAEQTQHGLFNKGILFNVGAWVGEKQRACDYFTLHDVDQVPTNPQNDYAWKPDPTHMCTYSTQYTYAQVPADPTCFACAYSIRERSQRSRTMNPSPPSSASPFTLHPSPLT
eukprot:452043-Rhodomonas_salina.2